MNSPTKCENCISNSSGIFCELEGSQLSQVDGHKVLNKYKKGQTLFVQGNHPFGIFCISKGNIKVTKVGADGKESIVRICHGGDVLGHRSLFSDENYTATATAMEDSEVCFIDKKFILKTIEEKPSVALNIINKLSKEMGSAETRLSSYHQKNVRERLAELLIVLSKSHGINDGESRTRIDIRLTREEMATMIGTANETLIRFMSEFKSEGIIEQDGKTIIVTDSEKLSQWANLPF
ncbi:hypothetical protein A9Q84_12495 [Halobacteriovorax marinus]|uniref:Crp/Fnr family transcriptional regulator n=1 Tax=Halobacteriovorax marinus TaxID=97084 RepID=A0A1Y5FDU7_9BACT|nr:hypothetical protein A9Q84_12495 [Halobacteriovorax marinus]